VLSWSGGMNPYKYGSLGTVEAGGYADLIIVNGNPLEDIHMIDRENVMWVMKNGAVYKDQLAN
jgi:imidazolonepropionase-like amidohydrolase